MKKMSVLLIIVLILSAMAISSAEGFNPSITFGATSNTEMSQGNGMQPTGQSNPKARLEEVLSQLVEDGVLKEEDATNLLDYMEANRPEQNRQQSPAMQQGMQQGQRPDPIADAATAGIISEAQAESIKAELGGPRQGLGQNSGLGMDQNQQQGMASEMGQPKDFGSTINASEAQAIADEVMASVGYTSAEGGYPIVDTGVTDYYSNNGTINEPNENDVYFGQDANYQGYQPSYTDNGDGTVTDNVTGLMWQQDPGEKMTWEEAVENLESFELGGYDDWRLPTVKELYSLVQFNGSTGQSADESVPYFDTDYFDFTYGDETGERFIDSQMATSTIYESTTMNGNSTMFGFNFADGRIKGYPTSKEFYVYYVRGNTHYGENQFVDNGDGTITDEATGLMWLMYDSGYYGTGDSGDGTMDWDDALAWCEDLDVAGYDDWKLPDAKELQSVVDYTQSPDTTQSAAIDPMFYSTAITNISGQEDFGYYWTSTTHLDGMPSGSRAVYIAFGRGLGEMNDTLMDVHGAGCQRSDPKTGDRDAYPESGHGPQGDVQTVFNMVRAVRVIEE